MATKKSRKWLREEWIRRLRSGNFLQGKGVLMKKGDDDWRYCCLGVACTILVELGEIKWDQVEMPANEIIKKEYLGRFGLDGDKYELPDEAMVRFGMHSSGGDHTIGSSSLAGMNDRGTTFIEIADALEIGAFWK